MTVIDETDATVLAGRQSDILKRLHESEGDELWDLLDEVQPGLSRTIGIRRQHEQRKAALLEFEGQIEEGNWLERDWQKFFEWNTWIFGFGLSYQFLNQLEAQPNYGGTTYSGIGGERGDFLLSTEADARFTVLVDIKKPDTQLLNARPYRPNSGYYAVSGEVNGGVAQVQANCETWLREGSLQMDNAIELSQARTHTHEPKGILIVGHTNQLVDNDRIGSFERFRRSTRNPELVTFDELLARAKYLVDTDFDLQVRVEGLQSVSDGMDDVPF